MIGRGGVGDGDFDDLVGADMAQGTKISPMTNEPAVKKNNELHFNQTCYIIILYTAVAVNYWFVM